MENYAFLFAKQHEIILKQSTNANGIQFIRTAIKVGASALIFIFQRSKL
jgi:hypothetical protein